MESYEAAYKELAGAVLAMMPADERNRFATAVRVNSEEGADALCDYVNNARRNAPTTLDESAIAMHEIMQSYERAGFTHDESMTLLMVGMENEAKARIAVEIFKHGHDGS